MTAADKMAQAIRAEPTELVAKWRVLELIAECEAEQAAAPRRPLPERIAAANERLRALLKDAELDYVQDDVPQAFVGPYRAGVGFHDGLFVAVDDANGQRVAEIYDIQSGAALVRRLNLSHAAEQAATPKAEAVAWLFICKKAPTGGQMIYATVDENDSLHWPLDQWRSVEKLPLYAAPQPPAEREPLTDEQCDKLIADNGLGGRSAVTRAVLIGLCRAAHGIGTQQP